MADRILYSSQLSAYSVSSGPSPVRVSVNICIGDTLEQVFDNSYYSANAFSIDLSDIVRLELDARQLPFADFNISVSRGTPAVASIETLSVIRSGGFASGSPSGLVGDIDGTVALTAAEGVIIADSKGKKLKATAVSADGSICAETSLAIDSDIQFVKFESLFTQAVPIPPGGPLVLHTPGSPLVRILPLIPHGTGFIFRYRDDNNLLRHIPLNGSVKEDTDRESDTITVCRATRTLRARTLHSYTIEADAVAPAVTRALAQLAASSEVHILAADRSYIPVVVESVKTDCNDSPGQLAQPSITFRAPDSSPLTPHRF